MDPCHPKGTWLGKQVPNMVQLRSHMRTKGEDGFLNVMCDITIIRNKQALKSKVLKYCETHKFEVF